MSRIEIKNVNGGNNVFGDNNTVHLTHKENTPNDGKVLTRDDYFTIVQEIIELEPISLECYLGDRIERAKIKNPDFVKILYKEISKVTNDIYQPSDLIIENGDFIMGKNSPNLVAAGIFLYMTMLEDLTDAYGIGMLNKIQELERDFFNVNFDTPKHRQRIQALREELKGQGDSKGKVHLFLSHINDTVDLKPNIMGFGINLNALVDKLLNRKKI